MRIRFVGSINSRMKDFYDLWVMANGFDFIGNVLQDEIRKRSSTGRTVFRQIYRLPFQNSLRGRNRAIRKTRSKQKGGMLGRPWE